MSVLELSIVRSGETGLYDVEIVHSPVGEASATVAIDCERMMQGRDHWQQALLASAVSTRRLVAGPETTVRAVGQDLFDVLLGHPVIGARYRSSVDIAAERGEPLRLVLRLAAPELTPLPWEAMYDAQAGTYVARIEPLVRHVPVAAAPPPLRVQQPVRVLGITASPRGLPALDVEAEEQYLAQALGEPVDRGQIELHWARDATWDGVHDLLLAHEWHVVHFIGHGDFDAEQDEGVLALVGGDGRAHHVEASRFADLLHEATPMPRLVVLNSCQSAVSGSVDLFSGTASALVRGGVSAVVAMQFEITDPAAAAFARGFYSAIAAGRPVDAAVRSGRVSILGMNGHTLEWITPVLYVRGRETRLFSLRKPREPGRSAKRAQSLRPDPLETPAATAGAVPAVAAGEALPSPSGSVTPIRVTEPPAAGPDAPAEEPAAPAAEPRAPIVGGPAPVAGPAAPAAEPGAPTVERPAPVTEPAAPVVERRPPAARPAVPRGKRRVRMLWPAPLLLLLAGMLVWAAVARMGTVEVDAAAYRDRPTDEVVQELQDLGLGVRLRGESHGRAEGTVLALDPTGRVERGSVITVVQSTGPRGLAEDDLPGTENEPATEDPPEGIPSGRPGSAPAAEVVYLPLDMVGRAAQPVIDEIRAKGVQVTVVNVPGTELAPGEVVRTDPVEGTPVQQNSTVTIWVAQ
ncbi:CHAT domain-containing protein [Kocuria nitroreducens]|uniref:CHAT domain-containing protein n=1 Tax=Kocuria nitroreducens TaxID=3058914 RepID=UPI0036D9B505